MTADCSPSWTSWTIKTYFSFKLFFLLPERKFYTYLIAFLLQKKYTKKSHGFRSFRGLLIRSLVTTRNKKISLQNFGDQLLKNQIVQKFYLSGQIWYPILSLRETAVVRFEFLQAKTKQFFSFSLNYSSFYPKENFTLISLLFFYKKNIQKNPMGSAASVVYWFVV